MLLTTALVGLLPAGAARRRLGIACYKMSFRTMMRGLSCVITFHDTQYIPEKSGVCVANHTSTIDVAVLSVNTCFSLVGYSFFSGASGYYNAWCFFMCHFRFGTGMIGFFRYHREAMVMKKVDYFHSFRTGNVFDVTVHIFYTDLFFSIIYDTMSCWTMKTLKPCLLVRCHLWLMQWIIFNCNSNSENMYQDYLIDMVIIRPYVTTNKDLSD